jgi:hypothetical protein
VSKESWITQTVFHDRFSKGLQEESKGHCEKEKISAKILVVENVLCPNTAQLLPAVENVLCPNTAQLLPAVEEEVIATSEASYV